MCSKEQTRPLSQKGGKRAKDARRKKGEKKHREFPPLLKNPHHLFAIVFEEGRKDPHVTTLYLSIHRYFWGSCPYFVSTLLHSINTSLTLYSVLLGW